MQTRFQNSRATLSPLPDPKQGLASPAHASNKNCLGTQSYDFSTALSAPRRLKAGFTLIELLITIGLIVLLFGLVGKFATNLSKGQTVDTGVSAISSQLEVASLLAQTRSTPTALLIYAKASPNSTELDYQLRYLQVVYLSEDEDGNEQWIPNGNGISLPAGVFFEQNYSAGEVRLNNLPSGEVDVDGNPVLFTAAAPVVGNKLGINNAQDWIAYGFSSSGAVVNDPEGDRIDVILQGKAGINADGELQVREQNSNKVGGVYITRYGKPVAYRDAAHIDAILTGVQIIEP